MALPKAQRTILEAAHDAHEKGVNGGINGRTLTPDDLEHVNELLIAGYVQWHPPGPRGSLLIPTPLGRERVSELRQRSKRAKKAAHKRK